MARKPPSVSKDLVEFLKATYPIQTPNINQLPVDIQVRAFHDGRQDIIAFLEAEFVRQEKKAHPQQV